METTEYERIVTIPYTSSINGTSSEKKVFEWLTKRNWTVLKRGWPDFLCVRKKKKVPAGCMFPDLSDCNPHCTNKYEIFCIEVKRNKMDLLRPQQQQMHCILRELGVPVYVVTEESLKLPEKRKVLKLNHDSLDSLRKRIFYAERSIEAASAEVRRMQEELNSYCACGWYNESDNGSYTI